MGEKKGMKALEAWCKRITEGYRDVNLENMTTSWRNGLAFCALIHHFRPDLIDFESLNKENIQQNNELAFSVAEKHLGIPALLEAEDMVKYKVPDKLSIMTYVSQFYQHFQGTGQNKTPTKTTKRPLETSTGSSTPSPDSPPGKVASLGPPSQRKHDVCQACQHRVYILERLIIDSKLYHRTCFKCCRCESVLKPGSYVEGQQVGQYECVSCPDEEEEEKAAVASMAAARIAHLQSPSEKSVPSRFQKPQSPSDDLKITQSTTRARIAFFSEVGKVDNVSEPPVSDNNKVAKRDMQISQPSFKISSSSQCVTKSDLDSNDSTEKPIDVCDSRNVCTDSEGNIISSTTALQSSETKGEKNNLSSVMSKEPNVDSNSQLETKVSDAPNDTSGLKVVGNTEKEIAIATVCDYVQVEMRENAENSQNKSVVDALIRESDDRLKDQIELRGSMSVGSIEDELEAMETDSNLPKDLKSEEEPAARPVPSLRSKIKRDSTDTSAPLEAGHAKCESHEAEVFLTPLPSPRFRKKLHSSSSEIGEEGNAEDKKKPVPKARPSKMKPPLKVASTPGTVVQDMPVIRPQISEKMLSPTKRKNKPGSQVEEAPESKDSTSSVKASSRKSLVVRPKSSGFESQTEEKLNKSSSFESGVAQHDVDTNTKLRTSVSGDSFLAPHSKPVKSQKPTRASRGSELNLSSKRNASPVKKTPPPRPQPPAIARPDSETLPSPIYSPTKKEELEYPDDLNPFNDDEEDHKTTTTETVKQTETKSLNPFDDSDDDDTETTASVATSTPVKKTNLFDDKEPPKSLRKIFAPKDLNPFLSDDDDEYEDTTLSTNQSSKGNFGAGDASKLSVSTTSYLSEKPTPMPRTNLESRSPSISPAGSLSKTTGRKLTSSPTGSVSTGSGVWYSPSESPVESPAGSLSRATGGRQLSSRDSGLDVSPTGSMSKATTLRKKRPAPKPPSIPQQLLLSPVHTGVADSSTGSLSHETGSPVLPPKKSPRCFKKIPAPPPPPPLSAPPVIMVHTDSGETSVTQDVEVSEKALKELDNQSLKSTGFEVSASSSTDVSFEVTQNLSNVSAASKTKNTSGNWKKKKPAPPVPLPPKRQTKQLPMEEIQRELAEIEEKQLSLEKQGVELEKQIREGFPGGDETNAEEDDLVMQLFELVNQKNVLFRRQAELVYLKRQQRLEEEHAELEYQIRCLMAKPENLKSEDDKEQEDKLINRLMDVVMQRNQIIESMETDRLREALEDQSIQEQLSIHQAAGSSRNSMSSQGSSNSLERKTKKEKKKKDKTLKGKNKEREKSKAEDEDKDLDDVEVAMREKNKKEKKRRWF